MQYRQRYVVVQVPLRRAKMSVLRVAWRWAATGINAQEPDCAPSSIITAKGNRPNIGNGIRRYGAARFRRDSCSYHFRSD